VNSLILVGGLIVAGCGSPAGQLGSRANAASANAGNNTDQMLRALPLVKQVDPWSAPEEVVSAGGVPGRKMTTTHYEIYTTLTDPLILRKVPLFMESARRAYGQTVAYNGASEKKHVIYLFGSRAEWEAFTRIWAGRQAESYLKIQAGAYYLNKACVAYHLGRTWNFSILAHEGWHQFSHETFAYRLPAWMDEGMATNFEMFRWEKDRVVFEPSKNGSRLQALRIALANPDRLIPLNELIQLDPGRVLHRSGYASADLEPGESPVAVYYSQIYALIRFLREEHYGRYYRPFQQMLYQGFMGQWNLPEVLIAETRAQEGNPTRLWNAQVGMLIFQMYMKQSPEKLEAEFLQFCRKITYGVSFQKQ